MKTLLTIIALALMALMPAAFADDHGMMDKMEKTNAKVNAVVFYSDTCGSCKILEPKMKEAMGVINIDRVNVVKLDFSNSETIENSKIKAAENGIDSTLLAYGTKTGFVILVDDAGNEITKLTKDDSSADIATKITAAALKVSETSMDKMNKDA